MITERNNKYDWKKRYISLRKDPKPKKYITSTNGKDKLGKVLAKEVPEKLIPYNKYLHL